VGYVRQLGPNSYVAKIGDPVILTFSACHNCEQCQNGHPAHCSQFETLNFGVSDATYVFSDSSEENLKSNNIHGSFFGQSSFSNLTIVRESSIVNVSGIMGQEDKNELALMAPLGCGVQTGTGAIINAANAGPKDRVVILGLGGVGLSAVMGAKIAGCAQIIGIDRYESRLELAKELGATDVINTASLSMSGVSDMVLAKTNNLGANITLDSTGVPELIQEALRMTTFKGKILQVGAAPMDAKLMIPIFEFMSTGKQFIGVVEGDVNPQQYIPQMVEWAREGRLPLEKIVQFYDAEDYDKAITDMKSGKTIKPIIRW
jgi:Zn-dependent alcohol dehydrogenase